jgi:tetraacyldisaccharide 4'-kinase
MKAPSFWNSDNFFSRILSPLGWLWALGSILRQKTKIPYKVPIPVIVVGNIGLGGSGKTPVALALHAIFENSCYLSKGYGRRHRDILRVNPQLHEAQRVGDEPLILAREAPCWVSNDRVKGAKMALSQGAQCLILDDGFQDPSLHKSLSIIVVDGTIGFGNQRCFPAGPLRESLKRGLSRTDCVVIMGEDYYGIQKYCPSIPVFHAKLVPIIDKNSIKNKKIIAFAGIAYPHKFFDTLKELGVNVIETISYEDHYFYEDSDLEKLQQQAYFRDAVLMTTEKDWVRLTKDWKNKIDYLPMKLEWQDDDSPEKIRKMIVP